MRWQLKDDADDGQDHARMMTSNVNKMNVRALSIVSEEC